MFILLVFHILLGKVDYDDTPTCLLPRTTHQARGGLKTRSHNFLARGPFNQRVIFKLQAQVSIIYRAHLGPGLRKLHLLLFSDSKEHEL